MNEELFDKLLRDEINEEVVSLPENIINSIDRTLKNLPERKRKKNIKGSWDFKFDVSGVGKENRAKEYNTFTPLKSVNLSNEDIVIEKISLTPINTNISIRGVYKNLSNNKGEDNEWFLFDDSNMQIQSKSVGGSSSGENFERELIFDPVKKIPKKLKVVPYKYINLEDTTRTVVSEKINSKYPIELSQGKIGKLTIDKIEFLKEKTLVHYKVEGTAPLYQYSNIFFIDDKGNEIWGEFDKMKRVNEASYNFICEFEPLDKNKVYNIGTLNFDEVIEIYEGFDIELE